MAGYLRLDLPNDVIFLIQNSVRSSRRPLLYRVLIML